MSDFLCAEQVFSELHHYEHTGFAMSLSVLSFDLISLNPSILLEFGICRKKPKSDLTIRKESNQFTFIYFECL